MLEDIRLEEYHKQVLMQLSEFDYEKKHDDICRQRVPGTRAWLLDTQGIQSRYTNVGTDTTLLGLALQAAFKSALTWRPFQAFVMWVHRMWLAVFISD